MALNQVTTMRLPSGVEIALVDWTDRPLYSTVEVESGYTTQQIDLFSYVIGDDVPCFSSAAVVVPRRSTHIDTNVSTPGAMSSSEEMLVYAIKPEIFAFQIEDSGDFSEPNVMTTVGAAYPNPTTQMVKELQARLVLQLTISQKVYAEAPFGYFNTGFGPSGIGTGPASATVDMFANQGWASQEAVRSYVIPHHIGGQEKYRVSLLNPEGTPVQFFFYNITPDVPTGVAQIRIYLDGLYKRPVS